MVIIQCISYIVVSIKNKQKPKRNRISNDIPFNIHGYNDVNKRKREQEEGKNEKWDKNPSCRNRTSDP